MDQQFPGDIAPLMRACADLARRRADDLARVRTSVSQLKNNLARTLVQFDHARNESAARIQALRAQTTQSLADNRRERSQQLADFRARLAKDHARTTEQTRQALGSFRDALQAAVSDIKKQTQVAKRARFKTGSFRHAAAPAKPPSRPTSVADTAPIARKRNRSGANDSRSFLDL